MNILNLARSCLTLLRTTKGQDEDIDPSDSPWAAGRLADGRGSPYLVGGPHQPSYSAAPAPEMVLRWL